MKITPVRLLKNPSTIMLIHDKEISINGKIFRIARLRHEWFEFLDEPALFAEKMKETKSPADVVPFLQEAHVSRPKFPFHCETVSASVLTTKNFDDWWENLHFK